MRSVPYFAYVVCGLALGVVLYLCWRANARGRVDSEQDESFVSPIPLDPPRAPCNVDFGSLVQDQFLAENANRGSHKCQHQYPDPTVFGGEIRMQQSPNRFVFCTSKDASQMDKCPAECTDGGCVSLQSEADNITNATRKKTKQFIKSLNQFEDLQFGPMRNLFDGVSLPMASEYAEEEEETEGITLVPGVYPTLKAELARREALIRELDNLQTDIQTATDALAKVKPHAYAQSVCKTSHPSVTKPIRGMKHYYYRDAGVASKTPPTDKYDIQYSNTPDPNGYSCFTQTPNSKLYAKWLNFNDIDGKICNYIRTNANTIGKVLVDDIRTKCEANNKCREQIKEINPKSPDVNQQWRNVIASDTAPSKHYKAFPKIPAFHVDDKTNQKCWTQGPTNKLKRKEQYIYRYINSPVPSNIRGTAQENAYAASVKPFKDLYKKLQCARLPKYPPDDAYNYILVNQCT